MKIHSLFSLIAIFSICSLHGETQKQPERFHIQKCRSVVSYPTEGDESKDIKYGDLTYHVRIFHPKVVNGPHFSTPFFWVSDREGKLAYTSLISVRSQIGGLSWHSINGYFFAEKKGKLRGFFLEDGFDNADEGSQGLILLHDGEKSSAWRWSYGRPAETKKGQYQISDANDPTKAAPAALLNRIAEVLDHAEKEADAWPGV